MKDSGSIDDIHARVPVDRVAARVVMFKGETFTPDKKIVTNDSETPIAIRKTLYRSDPNFEDLTGRRFGRFVVIGLARDLKGKWVVRCVCSRYSTRCKKAILNKENAQDRCEHCRHLAFLKKEDIWRRTGKDVDIRDF
jgi:hypothetical protein